MNPSTQYAQAPAPRVVKGSTQQIPRKEWSVFFDSFSRKHEGWLVSMELVAPELGDVVQVRDRPLAGITAELHRGGRDSIVLMFGRATSELTHIIAKPTRVWLKQAADGADEALEIEATDAPTTLLRIRSPRRTEEVDGLLPGVGHHGR